MNPLDEKGNETSDNYEDDYESHDENVGAKQDQMSDQSSKMVDSHAKNSEEQYDSDFFEEGPDGVPKSKNAQDYFREEEARKSRDTPVGGNPNSDGGSMFNQTGGQFLGRGQMNQTKSSIYKNEKNQD